MTSGFISLRRKYKIGAILLVVLAVVTYGRVTNSLDDRIIQDEEYRQNNGFESIDEELDMLDGKTRRNDNIVREEITNDAAASFDSLVTHYLQNEMDELARKSKRVIRLYKYATSKRGTPGLH